MNEQKRTEAFGELRAVIPVTMQGDGEGAVNQAGTLEVRARDGAVTLVTIGPSGVAVGISASKIHQKYLADVMKDSGRRHRPPKGAEQEQK